MTLRAIDLFCGIGGNSWGAQQAGVEIVAGFDKWDLAGRSIKTTSRTRGSTRKTCPSFRAPTSNAFSREIGTIDLILASPECTSHSVARGGKPKMKKACVFPGTSGAAEVFQLRWMVIENVVAMKSWMRYKDFLRVLHERSHYHCLPQSLTASDFGVPQRRYRLYILCDRDQKPEPVITTVEKQAPAAKVLSPDGQYTFTPLDKPGRAKKTIARAERGFAALGRETPFLMVYYGTDHAGGWQTLETPLRTVTTLDRFALVRPDGNSGHEMRMLQPPELQAAMGFPPEFKLAHGVRRDKIHLLGNAVCPPVMEAIVRSLTAGQPRERGEVQEPVYEGG